MELTIRVEGGLLQPSKLCKINANNKSKIKESVQGNRTLSESLAEKNLI
jgi:hypothetical protein